MDIEIDEKTDEQVISQVKKIKIKVQNVHGN